MLDYLKLMATVPESQEDIDKFTEKTQDLLENWSSIVESDSGLPDWIKQLTDAEVIDCKPDYIIHSGMVL